MNNKSESEIKESFDPTGNLVPESIDRCANLYSIADTLKYSGCDQSGQQCIVKK